ncbi:type II toxin-antitoxin system HigB family toxin (plasmid) [Rahnella aceris]|uniref:type II toxin-antitoxin system HigB family toxin n=1 Tax=Rahnella TaxID=34037 RepID=UPI001906C962|nr:MULTISPECIES: type II toxin-antitoxin system HigB family toxin [Rahnella]MCX2942907.1 type II toxin-antitoxin system HigB family toxin [Rahnella perminowiae]QQN37872.1 type II toxin-antitoxin system HigB family toxin [Rahnella aceris]
MKVRGLDKIHEFSRRNSQAKGALEAWHHEVCNSTWKKPQDIKNRFSSADFLSENKVIFNIKGNTYRLVVQVVYVAGVVIIERIGTHAEYDKWRLK